MHLTLETKEIIVGLRSVIQAFLSHELRAVKEELRHHSELFKMIQENMDKKFSAMQSEINALGEGLQEVKLGLKEVLVKLDLTRRYLSL
jgi:hypothetical protein